MNDSKMRDLLVQLYGEQDGVSVLGRLERILDGYRDRLSPRPGGLSQRDSMLITYADQVQQPGIPPLQVLGAFCGEHLSGVVTGIHILPFYPWTSDDGFAVVDYRQVSPEYGSWKDLRFAEGQFRLMFDAVINHVSVQNEWFQALLAGDHRYADYFIIPPRQADLSAVVRPRALPLLTSFPTRAGEKDVWTTFSTDQVDLNYKNPSVLLAIIDVLLFYVEQGADFLRMDAIAYLWKEPGTSCIHLPQTHALIRLFRAVLDAVAPYVSIITETNVPHEENISYFGDGTNEARLVYNFSLPPLLLHAFQTANAERLSDWAGRLRLPPGEVTFFNFLASHDGIGLNPLRGILPEEEIAEVVERTRAHGGLVSYKSMPDGSIQPYELNINFFDALNGPHETPSLDLQIDRFVTAHAILLALLGVPALYFHSLVGARGWPEGVAETGRNRTVNRQKFLRADLEAALSDASSRQSRVFHRLAHLLKVRAGRAAFHPYGSQRVISCSPAVFGFERIAPDCTDRIICLHNVTAGSRRIEADALPSGGRQSGKWRDAITGRIVLPGREFRLEPYESLWLGWASPGR
ncbi:MAG: sugar phosphorylase [Bacteroidota bacterium]